MPTPVKHEELIQMDSGATVLYSHTPGTDFVRSCIRIRIHFDEPQDGLEALQALREMLDSTIDMAIQRHRRSSSDSSKALLPYHNAWHSCPSRKGAVT